MQKNNPKPVKICVCGGHLTPALAVIARIGMIHPEWQVIFAGRKFAQEDDTVLSQEYKDIREKSIPFYPVRAGRFRRIMDSRTVISLLRFPLGLWDAFRIIQITRPDLVISFGSYVALPVALSARFFRIPVITHEQAIIPGLANRLISAVAGKVLVSFPETGIYFRKKKTILTGLPLRTIILDPPDSLSFRLITDKPILYITGGTTGSMSINRMIYRIIPKLVLDYEVIHQVGTRWESEAKKVRQTLRGDKRSRYHVFGYVSASDHAWLMHHMYCMVARSGANTVYEVGAVKKPAIFIPLPWSSGNEQYLNAKILADSGAAVILDQNHIDPQKLLSEIRHVTAYRSTHDNQDPSHIRTFIPDADRRIVDIMEQDLKSRKNIP